NISKQFLLLQAHPSQNSSSRFGKRSGRGITATARRRRTCIGSNGSSSSTTNDTQLRWENRRSHGFFQAWPAMATPAHPRRTRHLARVYFFIKKYWAKRSDLSTGSCAQRVRRDCRSCSRKKKSRK